MTAATLILSCLTTFFAFLAFYHTRERFRFELLDRRWQTYSDILEICSLHHAYGLELLRQERGAALNKQFATDRQKLNFLLDRSVRGTGFHTVRSLFGPEIAQITDRLNEHVAWFGAFAHGRDNDEEYMHRSREITQIINDLPKTFQPYVYFGGYRAWPPWRQFRARRSDRSDR